jgi:hypothetical protein
MSSAIREILTRSFIFLKRTAYLLIMAILLLSTAATNSINYNSLQNADLIFLKSANNNTNATSISDYVTFDSEFECGDKYWGIKNWGNKRPEDYSFGRSGDCSDNELQPKIPANKNDGLTHYARVVSQTFDSDRKSLAWQAVIQGRDPWGNSNNSTFSNKFPLPSQLDYNLEVNYLWFNDNTSKPWYGNVKANLLVNLWFADAVSPKTSDGQFKNVLVIDFAYANLINNGNGQWIQNASVSEGQPYYKPYAEPNPDFPEQIVYRYNYVVDNNGTTEEEWHNSSRIGIDGIIDDAFNYNYEFFNGTEAGKPSRSNYQLVNIEAGAEVWNDMGASGVIVAAFSNVELYY